MVKYLGDIDWTKVALRKESVDRNCVYAQILNIITLSLSARRAWIEIHCRLSLPRNERVALRKESVDRNVGVKHRNIADAVSLSARRAWIEMRKVQLSHALICGASLSARRAWIEMLTDDVSTGGKIKGRSPQGERG